MSQIYSLSNPPSAPQKKKAEKKIGVENVRPLFLPKSPISVSNPPAAPKKRYRRILPRPGPILTPPLEGEAWRVTPEDMWRDVRSKFLQYAPEDVAAMEDVDHLRNVYRWYNPSSCPRTVAEAAYLKLVSDAAEARLKALGSDLH